MHRRRQGGTGNVRPRNWKKCCRKMVLFPKALFLATTFLKLSKNSIFLLNFYQKFSKISQSFPTICIIRPNGKKWTHRFVNFFEKYAQIVDFLQFYSEIFWKISKISQNFPKICIFRPNGEKSTHRFANFLWKIC